MYTEKLQRILAETTPEEKSAIIRRIMDSMGIPYVTGQGGFELPSLFDDDEKSFEKKNELKVGPARTLHGPFASPEEDRHIRQYSLQLTDFVTEYGVQMDSNAA